ncbi:MAG: YqgE/AlgH family protein [Colwellia sp.]|nr:YqgE/AlgH family protein [Colwellia sp.]MCW8865758.1 YqgE/AlgH family protein [Colwellia sp.]MCW9081705.1 YqgE/AlgH family protein [Colwellia sp.]
MQTLENQFLIAMPSLGDDYFNKTVTYICEHNDEGAMGLIINMPVNITLHDLLKQIEENDQEDKAQDATGKEADDVEAKQLEHENTPDFPENLHLKHSLEQLVLSGGPISQNRGFVLHRTQSGWKSSLALSEEIMITTSKDILMALGTEKAPEQFMVTLGYAGWGPGQLEAELQANSWLTIDADSDILFNTPIEQRWQKATEKLGINIAHLSSDIGHA